MQRQKAPIIVLVIIAVVAISICTFLAIMPLTKTTPQPHQPSISTVLFVEDAALDESDNHGTYPKIVTVVIGENSTVRWVNQDTIPHGIPSPDDDGQTNPYFFSAVQTEVEHHPFLSARESFEYTFMTPEELTITWFRTRK